MAEPTASRPRFWLIYLVLAGVFFLFSSGLLGKRQPKEIEYDRALELARSGQIEKATLRPGDVVLSVRADGGKPAETVRAPRLPGVTDEPLVSALLDRKVPLTGEVPSPPGFLQMFAWIAPFLLITALLAFALRRAGQPGAGGPLSLMKSKAKVYDRTAQEPVMFSDVAGVDEAKDELVEVVQFLKEPERFRALGGRIPRGLLLIGPPGTGKTLLARAVAGEASVPFLSLNASEFVELFVGLGAARVRELFEQAKRKAPSIVFIDEIDAVGRTRGGVGTLSAHDEREQTLQQLLAELDGFDARTTVILMAATNRPEVLDPALLRPGRFDRQVVVDRPDLAGREAILALHARRVPLASQVDLRAVARRTVGMAGADLANIVNEAALAGARRGAKSVGPLDFEDAMDRVQLGLRRRGTILTPAERTRVAYHEAGHALVALALPEADPVERVSIVARTIGALGSTLQVPRDERVIATESELVARITVLLGGRAAEEIALGQPSTGAHDDLGRATGIVREMVTRLGMSRRLGMSALTRTVGAPLLGTTAEERVCSDETAREIDEEVRDRIGEAHRSARTILEQKREVLEAVARALLARETLTGVEVQEIARNARIVVRPAA